MDLYFHFADVCPNHPTDNKSEIALVVIWFLTAVKLFPAIIIDDPIFYTPYAVLPRFATSFAAYTGPF